MNDYLIDPMMFYWMGAANNIIAFFGFMAAAVGISIAITISAYIVMKIDKNHNYIILRNVSIPGIVLFILFSAIAIFTPNRETLIQMAVAKQVTYQNLDKAEQKIKGAVDYIFKKVNEIK